VSDFLKLVLPEEAFLKNAKIYFSHKKDFYLVEKYLRNYFLMYSLHFSFLR
jgi:hypothetical protein